MKRFVILLLAVISLVSCECPFNDKYCPSCHLSPSECSCSGRTSSDRFTARTLYGVWQVSYHQGYEEGIGITPKQIEFFDDHTCDITYSVGNEVDWWTDTYIYAYSSGYIKFSKQGRTFSFKVRNFLFPTLTLQDSHGTYEWYKVK